LTLLQCKKQAYVRQAPSDTLITPFTGQVIVNVEALLLITPNGAS